MIGRERPPGCPDWCVVEHGALRGEEDRVHLSTTVAIAGGADARLCASSDPVTGAIDGPYVLIGDDERSVEEVDELVERLRGLTTAGRLTRPGAPRTRLRDP